jgi:hypothetical protein
MIRPYVNPPAITITTAGSTRTMRHYFGDTPDEAPFVRLNVLAER